MHQYDHHIGDYTRDTVGLSMTEDGAYRRLLDQYYARELPLPKDKVEIYRMARATTGQERKAVDSVLSRYFFLSDDGWHQHRTDTEITKYHGRSGKAKAAAGLRWERERTRNGNANAYTDADANASETHILNTCEGNADEHAESMPRAHGPFAVCRPPSTGESKTRAIAPSALPDWLDAGDWDRWRKHRGKKLTVESMRLQLLKLEQLRLEGHEPRAMIDLAIECAWTTFWPPSQRGPPARKREQTLAERRVSTLDSITGQKGNGRDITGTSERVDSEALRSPAVDLRLEDGSDVGPGRSGRPPRNVG